MQSGLVKSCHHAVFDECWFHQAWRLPAAQLLYDLGTAVSNAHPDIPHPTATSMPSSASDNDGIIVSIPSKTATPTPLNVLPLPHQIPIDDDSSTSSSTTSLIADVGPTRALTVNVPTQNTDASVVDHYGITGRDLEQVYFSQHHYGHAFEECFAYSGSPTTIHPTAGMELRELNGRVIITDISIGTPCAKIPHWKSRLRNVCLLMVHDSPISTIAEVKSALAVPSTSRGSCKLLLSSSELRDGLTYKGIPQISLDQLNPRHFFCTTPHN